jgi:hypothetical protein
MIFCINCDDPTLSKKTMEEKKNIVNILNYKLPIELCEKIISYYKPIVRCSMCNGILCYKHGVLANNDIKKYYFRFMYYYNNYNYLCQDCSYKCWDRVYE